MTFELSSINNLSMIILMVSDTGILVNKFSISIEAMNSLLALEIFLRLERGVCAIYGIIVSSERRESLKEGVL